MNPERDVPNLVLCASFATDQDITGTAGGMFYLSMKGNTRHVHPSNDDRGYQRSRSNELCNGKQARSSLTRGPPPQGYAYREHGSYAWQQEGGQPYPHG